MAYPGGVIYPYLRLGWLGRLRAASVLAGPHLPPLAGAV